MDLVFGNLKILLNDQAILICETNPFKKTTIEDNHMLENHVQAPSFKSYSGNLVGLY